MTELAGAEHAHESCAETWGADVGSWPIPHGPRRGYEDGSTFPCCGVCREPLDREAWEREKRRALRTMRLVMALATLPFLALLAVAVAKMGGWL